ncbi:hypothetical protein [Micromonospora sp. C31]|uniref:hypothetical protein n=1 Tax=Micromonospora sp. C31 TaxID=2824876 RepID=UPI001FFDA155|nr:hypothetical protein [Micromonospora sp. C31]
MAFALLSLAAQFAEAEPSVWGWIVAAVPSLVFLALVKVVLSNAPVTPPAAEPDQPTAYRYEEPKQTSDVEPVGRTTPTPPVIPAVLPAPGVVQPHRPQVVGIIR